MNTDVGALTPSTACRPEPHRKQKRFCQVMNETSIYQCQTLTQQMTNVGVKTETSELGLQHGPLSSCVCVCGEKKEVFAFYKL